MGEDRRGRWGDRLYLVDGGSRADRCMRVLRRGKRGCCERPPCARRHHRGKPRHQPGGLAADPNTAMPSMAPAPARRGGSVVRIVVSRTIVAGPVVGICQQTEAKAQPKSTEAQTEAPIAMVPVCVGDPGSGRDRCYGKRAGKRDGRNVFMVTPRPQGMK